MKTIVHLSDLHFGRLHAATVEPLVELVWALGPDVVAVSGDLTQRARRSQFRQARAFLDRLPHPQITVPGNHDVPLYRFWSRALWPLRNYRRYISDDVEPFHHRAGLAVAGLNTARAATTSFGRVNAAQIERVLARFAPLGEEVTKVVVSHHPFDLPEHAGQRELVGRAEMGLTRLVGAGVDIFLSGHLHASETVYSAERFAAAGRAALVVHAGTATSSRLRHEENAFNVLRLADDEVEIDHLSWSAPEGRFAVVHTERSRRGPEGWRPPREAPPPRLDELAAEGA